MKILVIDDHSIVRDYLRDILEDKGHEIYEAENAYAAIRNSDVIERCDLIITDMHMPNGSGLEFLQAYRRLTRNPVPVLVHSSEETFRAEGGHVLNLSNDIPRIFPFAEFRKKPSSADSKYILDFIERKSG